MLKIKQKQGKEDQALNIHLHIVPEKFKNGAFSLKTRQTFHTTPEKV